MEALERTFFSNHIFSVISIKLSSKEESTVRHPEMRHPLRTMSLEAPGQETSIHFH